MTTTPTTPPAIPEEERHVVTMLAFASREFDRVRDLIVVDDEPGQREVAAGVAGDPEAGEDDKGAARKLLGAIGAVARTAGRLVTGSMHPAADAWESASLEDRIDWWVGRFGTAAAALAAVPGLGGKIGKLAGIGDVVGAAAQVLVVNAVAREIGVTDVGDRIVAAGRIVLGHDLDPTAVGALVDVPEAQPEPEAPGDTAEDRTGLLARVGRTASLVWRVAGRIRRVRSDLDKRQQGGFLSRALSNLPAVGALGAFVSERKGISEAADQARVAFGS